jgi:hypothetical protein
MIELSCKESRNCCIFLSLGIKNNLIAFLTPIVISMIAIMHRNHSLAIEKIRDYLIDNYEIEKGRPHWRGEEGSSKGFITPRFQEGLKQLLKHPHFKRGREHSRTLECFLKKTWLAPLQSNDY